VTTIVRKRAMVRHEAKPKVKMENINKKQSLSGLFLGDFICLK